jgi:hypothetical protein
MNGSSDFGYGAPGDRFIASQGWKSVSDPQSRGQRWSTGPVEVSLSTKGTLLEGIGSPGSGSGGGFVPVPQVAPGIVTTLFQPLSVEEVFASAVAARRPAAIRSLGRGTTRL